MMHTVVTGAAGFIGSRLIVALNQAGITDILAVDDLESSAKAKNLFGVEIADYLDKREFLAQLETGRLDDSIDAIMHLGACSDTMESDGRYMMENNYAYSKVVFDWCQDQEVSLIYASSAAVYGPGREFGEARENEDPLNVYAYSKSSSTSTCASASTNAARRSRDCGTSTSMGRMNRTRGAWPRWPCTPSTSSRPRAA